MVIMAMMRTTMMMMRDPHRKSKSTMTSSKKRMKMRHRVMETTSYSIAETATAS